MKTRIAAASCAVVLAAGGVVWWAVADDGRPSSTTTGTSPSGDPDAPDDLPSSMGSAAPSGKPVAGCATTPPDGRIPDAFWGMHVTTPVGDGFPDAPIAAVNLTTSGTYWNQVETAPGRYDFSLLDDIVATSQDRHAQPMAVLGFTPTFHAGKPSSPTAAATMPDETAWRAWITAVVTRYGDRLDYQVWPEPNIISNWAGTPAQMARLTVIAGGIIHEKAPDALVVAPATTLRLEPQQEWMDRFWASEVDGAPVADSVDAVALDPFPVQEGTPEDSLDLLCTAREILAKNDVDLPLWTNEINYGVPSGGVDGVQPYTEAKQAAVVARTYLLHAALDVERVYWLGWFSFPGAAVAMSRDGVEPTQAGRAFSTVHGWLAGTPWPACQVEQGVYTCVVDKGDTSLRILWRERGTSAVDAPSGATRVEGLAGSSERLKQGAVVRVGQSPVAIVVPASS